MGGVPQFIDNGTMPEFFVSGLQEVEVMGAVSRFALFVLRRTPRGVLYREACFSFVMPNQAVGPAIALAVLKTQGAVDIPAIAGVAKLMACVH